MTDAAQDAASLRIEGASVTRGGRIVVAGVAFKLDAGDVVLLKGPNGSGKTSLLRAIAGLCPIDGELFPATPEQRRERIIYCGHADGVKAALTVAETLAFWTALYRAPTSYMSDAIAEMALEGLQQRRAGALSAGQKRRVALARLLIARKPVWLLDEPTASIDAESVERLVSLIAHHAARGGAALVATHDRLPIEGARSLRIEACP